MIAPVSPEAKEWSRFLQACRVRRYRSMREFAEQEIVLPSGPFEGWRFSCDRQPYSRLLFNEIDSGRWNRFFITGSQQAGKSLHAFIVPICYHLFEIGETVIAGVPSLDVVADKWADLKQVIERTRYRDLLPRKGGGSRGGIPSLIIFGNGAKLRFMTGGGDDKSRASFTSRVLVVTETDGFDETSATSREADKFSQLEGRTRAFANRKRVYAECTVSTEKGRTWQEYINGSASRILLPCPHCGEFVQPEREHLKGWKDAESEFEAREKTCFVCPACSHAFSGEERQQANLRAIIVHRGQDVHNGEAVGPLPQTQTLGFRWSAVNNLFVEAGDIGEEEWKSQRDVDHDNTEKKLLQFTWAKPYKPDAEDTVSLSIDAIQRRRHDLGRGIYPPGTVHTTIGFDSGMYRSWFVELAWTADHRAYLTDHGVLSVSSKELGLHAALLATLHEFAGQCLGNSRSPDAVWFDSSFETETHYQFAREIASPIFQPVQGFGESQRTGKYNHPKSRAKDMRQIGEQWYSIRDKQRRVTRVDLNSDYWKLMAQKSLAGPIDRPGSVTLFNALENVEHLVFAQHMLSEKKVEEFVQGKGLVTKWQKISKNNHLFDCLAYALAAGSRLGHSVIQPKPQPTTTPTAEPSVRDSDEMWSQQFAWDA